MALARAINLCSTKPVVQRFTGTPCAWKASTPEMWLDPAVLQFIADDASAVEVQTWYGEPMHAISIWYQLTNDTNSLVAIPPTLRFVLDVGCDGHFNPTLAATLSAPSFNNDGYCTGLLFQMAGVIVDSYRLRVRMPNEPNPAIRCRMTLQALMSSACGSTEFIVPFGGQFVQFN